GLLLGRQRARPREGGKGCDRLRRLAGGLPEVPPRMSRAVSRGMLAAWLREVGVDYVLRPSPGGETLDDIRKEMTDCRRCPLCGGRGPIVFGVGNPRARLMFVGEGPGV